MSRIAVLQSNYIPWRGYFDIIKSVDKFVFYDEVQFTKNDWRNRNQIKSKNGLSWLSIPVGVDIDRTISEVRIPDSSWQKKHWKSIKLSYSSAQYFKNYHDFFEEVYLSKKWFSLSELNQYLIQKVATEFLGIKTIFDDSKNYSLSGVKQDRLLSLLEQLKATTYVSGPSGQNYIDPSEFKKRAIDLKYISYDKYLPYPQFGEGFTSQVSIIDGLFHCGEKILNYCQ